MARRTRTRLARTSVAVLGAVLALLVGAAPAGAQTAPAPLPGALPAAVPGPPAATFPAAFLASLLRPALTAPGANDPTCRPSAAHPRPVVLVHGTILNSYSDFAELSPALVAAGYCVWAPSYGGLPGSPLQATGDIPTSAAQVSAVIDAVLATTGADQVDLVGHSQGGMLPRYVIKNLPAPERIASLTALSPSNLGTTFFGILPLVASIPGGEAALGALSPAIVQQRQGSAFLTALNAGDPTPGDVRYTTLQTRYDEVVTPFTNAFLPGASNTLLQDVCPQDFTDHLGITYDPVAIALVLQSLDPTAPAPVCGYVPPLIS